MAYIFRAPVGLDKVANFLADLQIDFFRGFGYSSGVHSELRPWDEESLLEATIRSRLPSGNDAESLAIRSRFDELMRAQALAKYAASPSNAGLSVVAVHNYSNGTDLLKTRIFNLSAMKEAFTAEKHFPSPVREYGVVSFPSLDVYRGSVPSTKLLDAWASFRDAALLRAQDNIKSQMAFASIGRDMQLFKPD